MRDFGMQYPVCRDQALGGVAVGQTYDRKQQDR
jgi:hypothetical protein